MPRSFLVIDGYNLMHAAGMARRRYGPGQLERCRTQLLRHLSRHLTPQERERTTIIFDAAAAPPDLPRRLMFDAMTVGFAAAGQEADDTIEELIARHSAPRQIRVVSSDHRLQRSARKRRGSFVDSDDFIDELERRGPIDRTPLQPGDQPGVPGSDDPKLGVAIKEPDPEAEDWLRVFADVTNAATEFDLDGDAPARPLDDVDVRALQKEIDAQHAIPPPSRASRRQSRKDV